METKEYIADLVAKSRTAQKELEKFTQEQVDAVCRILAKVVYDNAEQLAKLARDESRMGVYEDKVNKCRGKAGIIWNSLKGKKSVGVIEEDEESGLTLVARPIGVVAAIAPCTNPIVTPMCNCMFAIKSRNTIIISPHPRTRNCTKVLLDMWLDALKGLNLPENTIQIVEDASIEASAELMKACDVVIATGGMGMVKSAYSSGKPALGVGAGNVQCIVDRGVDIKTTVPKIIDGRKFDNGIICSGEQTIFAPAEDYDAIIKEAVAYGAFYVDDKATVAKFRDAIFPLDEKSGKHVMNKDLVGQSVQDVAKAAGVAVPEGTKVILLKADTYGKADMLSKEKMCPVIATYAYDKFEDAVAMATANLEFEGKGHSVSLHSNNEEHIKYAGCMLPVSRVLINQICSTMNGGAFANSLTPTTTLGCGSWGNNSISENLSYKHLMNVTRIAKVKKGFTGNPTPEEIWG